MHQKKPRFSIAFKLSIYFILSLLIVTIFIGISFTFFFRDYYISNYKENMLRTAVSIADTMSEILSFPVLDRSEGTERESNGIMPPQSSENRKSEGSFLFSQAYFLRLLSNVSDANVWIINGTDPDKLIFMTNRDSEGNSGEEYTFDELPENAQEHVGKVLQGYVTYSEEFSPVLSAKTLTVGVPLTVEEEVIGVVLIHSPASGINDAIMRGYTVLMTCLVGAILVGIAISIFTAYKFTKPMKKINNAAKRIYEGDYSAVTDVRQRDEIGELAATIDEMSAKLQVSKEETEKLYQMRQDFVANISHELRTPVTVIRGSLEALNDGIVYQPQQVKEYYKELLNESIYMQRMVNDLLDLSRLQSAEFSINMDSFNLYDCVGDAVRSVRALADKKGLAVNFKYDTMAMPVYGDYDRIRQMLMIVFDNAVKFSVSPEYPVKIEFLKKSVSVTNVGEGIAQEDLPYIFDRFYKSRSEQNKSGTGLGLPIAKQIAIRHGIGVSAQSHPGGETVFWFDFSGMEIECEEEFVL